MTFRDFLDAFPLTSFKGSSFDFPSLFLILLNGKTQYHSIILKKTGPMDNRGSQGHGPAKRQRRFS